jgi:hypothetical protein
VKAKIEDWDYAEGTCHVLCDYEPDSKNPSLAPHIYAVVYYDYEREIGLSHIEDIDGNNLVELLPQPLYRRLVALVINVTTQLSMAEWNQASGHRSRTRSSIAHLLGSGYPAAGYRRTVRGGCPVAKVGRARRRADRIRADVPMARVLADYGYAVSPDGGDREQQFPCDLHGDGRDGKASGRLYPTSNSMYCFACGRARDAVSLAMEKEGLKFVDALDKIERRYGLPPLPDDGTDDEDEGNPDDIAAILAEKPVSFEEASARTDRFLRRVTAARTLPMAVTLRVWAEFDRARHGATNEGWADDRAAAAVESVRVAARTALGIDADG